MMNIITEIKHNTGNISDRISANNLKGDMDLFIHLQLTRNAKTTISVIKIKYLWVNFTITEFYQNSDLVPSSSSFFSKYLGQYTFRPLWTILELMYSRPFSSIPRLGQCIVQCLSSTMYLPAFAKKSVLNRCNSRPFLSVPHLGWSIARHLSRVPLFGETPFVNVATLRLMYFPGFCEGFHA